MASPNILQVGRDLIVRQRIGLRGVAGRRGKDDSEHLSLQIDEWPPGISGPHLPWIDVTCLVTGFAL